ncbi:MAG: hypothetical protein R6W95_11605 [Desulfosarcina sp.]
MRALIDETKKNKPSTGSATKPIPLAKPRGELSSLLHASYPKLRMSDWSLKKGSKSGLKK